MQKGKSQRQREADQDYRFEVVGNITWDDNKMARTLGVTGKFITINRALRAAAKMINVSCDPSKISHVNICIRRVDP